MGFCFLGARCYHQSVWAGGGMVYAQGLGPCGGNPLGVQVSPCPQERANYFARAGDLNTGACPEQQRRTRGGAQTECERRRAFESRASLPLPTASPRLRSARHNKELRVDHKVLFLSALLCPALRTTNEPEINFEFSVLNLELFLPPSSVKCLVYLAQFLISKMRINLRC